MPGGRLARRDALFDPFEAVVERIAHEVHERVAERVDHGAVELGVLAHELQLDLLAELGREVAHEPREAQEDGFHGDHPDLHDHRLQGVRGAREVLHGLREARHVGLLDERLDLRAVQDELAHEVHELVQAFRVDADGGRATVLVAAGLLLGGRGRLLGGRRRSGSGRGGRSLAGGHVHGQRLDRRGRRGGDRFVDLVGRVERRVGRGLEDVHLGHLGHGGDRVLDLGVGALGDHPGVDLAAVERVDGFRRRDALERLAVAGDHRQDHVGPHGRHRDVLVERRGDLDHTAAVGQLGELAGQRDVGAGDLRLLLGRAIAHQSAQALDEGLRLDVLLAGHVDRLDGGRQRVQALEEHVDRDPFQPALALAQQLEHVLHLVRERRHAGEAHRRAHALQGMRDPEDLIDDVLIVGGLLDLNDREVELLYVLAPLGQEHREILVH